MSIRKVTEEVGKFRAAAVVLGRDVFKYGRLKRSRSGDHVRLRVRTIGGASVAARSRTTDAAVVLSCFYDQYHLPPRPLPAAAVILDLGANVGYTILHLKFLYPQATVVGVEMDPDNFALCVENTRSLTDCPLVNAAVSAIGGRTMYAKDTEADAYHIHGARKTDETTSGDLQEVDAVPVADLMTRFGLGRVDYVKMDIEGAETAIFLSAPLDWLDRVNSLNIEIHEGEHFDAILKALQARGFRAWKDTKHWSLILAVRD